MTINQFLNLQTEYDLKEREINCILLYFAIDNQQLAFAGTIATIKKTKNIQQAANYFFNLIQVKRFIFEQQKLLFPVSMGESDRIKLKNESGENKKGFEESIFSGDTTEFTKDNIKEVLELEFSKITKPEQRTALLIRIADLLSLQNSDSKDVEKPAVYLPNLIPVNVL